MEAGGLVSDEIVLAILRDRLAQPDCAKGVMLDGFPRTTGQAEALDALLAEAGQQVDAAISLEVDDVKMVDPDCRPLHLCGLRRRLSRQLQGAESRRHLRQLRRARDEAPCR